MPNVVQTKMAMRAYADKHGITKPGVVWTLPLWGKGAKTLAWRITSHAGKVPSTDKAAVDRILFPTTKPHVIETNWQWAHALSTRVGSPPGIVWHNSAGNGTAAGIHAYHISLGWSGIAYHYYVRKDGSIWAGRPEWAMGGHCLYHNDWLGVCAEGNYETVDKTMPAAQLASLKALHRYLHAKYHGLPDKRHSAMPGNSTACPGKYYPFDQITGN